MDTNPGSISRLAVTDPCAYLQRLIDAGFAFLTQEAEYTVVHVQPGQRSGCVVIFEGSGIRIRLQTTRDEELNILIGDSLAPLGWKETVGDTRVWHYLTGIAGYIDGDLGFGEKVVNRTRDEVERARRTVATDRLVMLSNYLERIEVLFSDGRFEELRGDYEEFLRKAGERTRAAYVSRSKSGHAGTNEDA